MQFSATVVVVYKGCMDKGTYRCWGEYGAELPNYQVPDPWPQSLSCSLKHELRLTP